MASARARHILVPTEQQCLDLKKQIDEGADFGEIAKVHSACPSKNAGGDLGSFGPGQMVPEFDRAIFTGEVGATLGPVRTKFGYHLIEITERHE